MFESGTRHEVNRWDDVRPFLREMASYLGWAKESGEPQ
jgi:hypothetical protein